MTLNESLRMKLPLVEQEFKIIKAFSKVFEFEMQNYNHLKEQYDKLIVSKPNTDNLQDLKELNIKLENNIR